METIQYWNRRLKSVYLHFILGLGAAIMVLPFIWMLITSVKAPGTEFAFPPQWIPDTFEILNYRNALDRAPLMLFMFNSIKVATLITIGQLITASLAAFAFARLQFPGRDVIFVLYLATMMIPEQVTLLPQFVIMKNLGWLDTHNALIFPKLVEAFGVFLLRQFFLTIPKELEESARIDGCGPFRIYWHIILPISKPALSALGIFVFMGSWNNLLHPLVFLTSMELKTLPVGLAYFVGFYQIDYTMLMAATTMSLLPVIIVYLFAQKYFIEGITLSGIKG
jgi:multiple sugar transport system permease protein